jgi:phosphoglycolate phosphatase
MMKYKHIIWDWNGTLLNDRWLCVEAINQALGKRNLPTLTEEQYKEVFSFPVENYYKKVGFDFDKEHFHVAGDEFVNYYSEHFQNVELHAEAIPVLNQIRKSGRSQSVLSAGKQDFLNDWIKNHNLSDYFIKVLGIDNQYATGKTALGVGWMDKIHYDSIEIIMVGDTIHDSEVAEAMGIDCVLVEHGHVSRKRLETTGRKVISDLNEFLYLLNET